MIPNDFENGKYNLISGDLMRFRKDFSVCRIVDALKRVHMIGSVTFKPHNMWRLRALKRDDLLA